MLILIPLVALIISGCAENHQNPNITTYQPGDEQSSCEVIQSNIQIAKNQLAQAQHGGNMQTGRNIVAGAAGIFTLGLAWLAIDTGDGHNIDATNAQSRIDRLNTIAATKGCR